MDDKDSIARLRRDRRTTLNVSVSDKEEFSKLKGELSDWQLFRKMLAVYMAHLEEADKSRGGIAA